MNIFTTGNSSKRVFLTCVLGLLAIIFSCSDKPNVTVALLNGANIPRSLLIDWITFNGEGGENTFRDPDAMENYLAQMLLERAASQEYRTLKAADDDVEKTILLASDTILAKKYLKNAVLPEWNRAYPVYIVEELFIPAQNSGVKISEFALEILSRAKKGKELNDTDGLSEMMQAYYSKEKIVFDDEACTAALSLLADDGLVKEPVVSKDGVRVLRLRSVLKLTYRQLCEYAGKNEELVFLKEKFATRIAKDLIDLLVTQPGVVFNAQGVDGAPDAEVFIIKDKRVVRKDLDNLIAFYDRKYTDKSGKSAAAPDSGRRLSVARNVFEMELIKREAVAKDFSNDPAYVREKEFLSDMIRSRAMLKRIISERVKVTEKDVLDEYTRNKESRYSAVRLLNGKPVKLPEPYARVKESIKILLQSEHEYAAYEGWKSELIRKYRIKIIKKNLVK